MSVDKVAGLKYVGLWVQSPSGLLLKQSPAVGLLHELTVWSDRYGAAHGPCNQTQTPRLPVLDDYNPMDLR